MTQTLEPGIKREHSKGKWTSGYGAQITNAEHRSLGIGVPARRSATERRSSAGWDELRVEQISRTATAVLFAVLPPAFVMARVLDTAEDRSPRIRLTCPRA